MQNLSVQFECVCSECIGLYMCTVEIYAQNHQWRKSKSNKKLYFLQCKSGQLYIFKKHIS